MPRPIGTDERRARLARRHLLLPSLRTDDVAAIADAVVALHSTDPVTVHLSAMQRMGTRRSRPSSRRCTSTAPSCGTTRCAARCGWPARTSYA